MYKEEYAKRKKVRHVRHWDFPPVLPFMGPNIPDYPPTFPRCPPGSIIGGDYDLHPGGLPGVSVFHKTARFINKYTVFHRKTTRLIF